MKTKKRHEYLLFLLPIIVLLSLSLLNMEGATYISKLYSSNFEKQALWILIGSLVMFVIYKIDLSLLLKSSTIFYILGCISLVLVLFFGKNVNGANSWFKVGQFSFQPSELFKFFYILFLANIIGKDKKGGFKLFLKILFYTFIPCMLIFLEPDTGVVLMYLLMMFGILVASKVKKRHITFMFVTGIVLLSGFVALYFLKSDLFISLFGTSFFYRMDRLLSFKNASSYQLSNALIGIGASGPFGFGLRHSKIYIPEVTTDFVFALTICNFGFIVGIFVVLIYTFILYMLHRQIGKTKKQIHKCILSSIFYMMLFQVGEHILMNIGLTPITGITLPFLSYGGSSLLSYFMLFGLILNIMSKEKRKI